MADTLTQPNYLTQLGSTYMANIDAAIAVLARLGGWFNPHEQTAGSPSPDMTVVVDAGFVWDGTTLTEKAAQTVTGFVAPASGTRIDRICVNKTNGDALRVTGTALAGSPSATPPAIPEGYMPCCRIAIGSTDTAIINLMITNEQTFVTNASSFPAGTRMLFQQTSAPIGWTKEASATYNDAALRLVTGVVGTGGVDAFSTHFGTGKSTAAFTLTTAEMPSHNHAERTGNDVAAKVEDAGGSSASISLGANASPGAPRINTDSTGGGGAHSHTLNNFNIKFADCIIASKD